MKKFSLCILAGLLALVLFLNPISVKAENPAEENAPAVSLTYTSLEESEKWILDEVLSDYVSEHVVDMEEASVPYTIGELIDRGTSSYLFYQDEQADGTVYTAAGYALTQDGSYVYFELTSASPLDTATVDFEIAKNFGSSGDASSLS